MSSASSESAVVTGIMVPTMVELATMPTVSEIASCCDFEESDDLTGLLTLLGAKTTPKTRILGASPQQSFELAIKKSRLPSGPVLQAKAVLMGAVARLALEKALSGRKAMELKEFKARAKLAIVSAVLAQYTYPAFKMIKFSTVVVQADDREVRPLEQNQVDSAYAVCKARMGNCPRPEEDVTVEQLAALRALFSSRAAVRGPGSVGAIQASHSTQISFLMPGVGCPRYPSHGAVVRAEQVHLCFRSSRRPA